MTIDVVRAPERQQAGNGSSWLLCGGCGTMVYGKRWVRDGRVCGECGWHAPLTAAQRLDSLLDPGTAELVEIPAFDADPLEFTDSRPYRDRLRDARASTGLDEAAVCARGSIHG
nr:hypothetical protein [Micromonospora sp. DSM 115978]